MKLTNYLFALMSIALVACAGKKPRVEIKQEAPSTTSCTEIGAQLVSALQSLEESQRLATRASVDGVDQSRGSTGKLIFPLNESKNLCKLELYPVGDKLNYGLTIHKRGKGTSMEKYAGLAIGKNRPQKVLSCKVTKSSEKVFYDSDLSIERDIATGLITVQGLRVGYLDQPHRPESRFQCDFP